MGKIFTLESDMGTMSAKIFVILFDFGIYREKRKNYIEWGGKFNKSRYLKFIHKAEKLINVNNKIINKCYKKGREIISIIERKDLIYKISKDHPEKNITLFIEKNGTEHLNGKIVLSTPQKARDGLDVPWKDCLILPTPISNIEQAIGRIRRKYKGKKQPIVFDYVDIGCKYIALQFFNRKNYYKKEGWEIEYIYINDDKAEKVEASQAFSLIKNNK